MKVFSDYVLLRASDASAGTAGLVPGSAQLQLTVHPPSIASLLTGRTFPAASVTSRASGRPPHQVEKDHLVTITTTFAKLDRLQQVCSPH